ncbi:hypothetical protein AAFF_G00068220 [Aldrovandia affinis]|uniref:Protein MRVI1 n=1 Tax=Aldrovandia affinis TaxID=143900 RepID=A0AAD7RZE9_9TELE|nr:hypothetical protein AAFF_G00068220 [Aldrovandia affinis]
MPTLPEEEVDSPGESSTSSSPSTCSPVDSRAVTMALRAPSIIFPKHATASEQDPTPLEQSRPHSPRARLSRNRLPSSGGSVTTVDSAGNVIDLLKAQLPDLQLSEEDRRRNLELLQEAKRVSEHFLSRRGRRSTCSLSHSPTAGLSPNHTPRSSPVPSGSISLPLPAQNAADVTELNCVRPLVSQRTETGDSSSQDQEQSPRALDWQSSEKRKVSSGTLSPRPGSPGAPRESSKPCPEAERGREDTVEERVVGGSSSRNGPDGEDPPLGVAKPVPRPPAPQGLNPPAPQGTRPAAPQGPRTAEVRTLAAFPPVMQALPWDTIGSILTKNSTNVSSLKPGETVPPSSSSSSSSSRPNELPLKAPGHGDSPDQPAKWQKLAKLREEHKLMRNQNAMASKLPDLSESAEQERGPPPEGDPKAERSDVMPHISDVMLRKMKLHRAQAGCAPPLTEKEVENAFVQLSLAFRNDNYTLETRLRQAERERNLTEENTEKELEEFKGSLKPPVALWQNPAQRESHQRLLETTKVLQQLAMRLSCRAEMVGAVRQEKRMNKATEVMMQYVENLKRTYEKDHAELMEFKKLANQNSGRCFGGSIDNGDDGVPRSSRSMSLTLGKPLPRRRVSLAVVPKFSFLKVPSPTTSPLLPALCEANVVKCVSPSEAAQTALIGGKARDGQEGGTVDPAKPDDIEAQVKARIEEDAYNKGYLEGLRRSKEIPEEEKEEGKEKEKEEESSEQKEEKKDSGKKCNRKLGYRLDALDQLGPKLFRWDRLTCVAMALFALTLFALSFFSYFGDAYGMPESAPAGKSTCPGKKKVSGWNVRYQPANPRPE